MPVSLQPTERKSYMEKVRSPLLEKGVLQSSIQSKKLLENSVNSPSIQHKCKNLHKCRHWFCFLFFLPSRPALSAWKPVRASCQLPASQHHLQHPKLSPLGFPGAKLLLASLAGIWCNPRTFVGAAGEIKVLLWYARGKDGCPEKETIQQSRVAAGSKSLRSTHTNTCSQSSPGKRATWRSAGALSDYIQRPGRVFSFPGSMSKWQLVTATPTPW